MNLKVCLGTNTKVWLRSKEKLEKTRNVKNNDKSQKLISRGERDVSYIMIELYLNQKKNRTISTDQLST